MIQLHPVFLKKNGRNEFVVLPYEELVALQELIADVRDLLKLESVKRDEGHLPCVSLEEVEKELGLA